MVQLNVSEFPQDEKEKLKEYLRVNRDAMSIKDWILEKIEQDTREEEPSKITDFHDKYVRSMPAFYAKRVSWVAYLAYLSQDAEAIKEFESRMRMLRLVWNRIYGMKDNTVRLEQYVKNPQSVRFG
jgi:hypothetical protein